MSTKTASRGCLGLALLTVLAGCSDSSSNSAFTGQGTALISVPFLGVEGRLNSGPDYRDAELPSIAVDGNDLYVVWEEERFGRGDIYFNCSKDRGQTWLDKDVRISGGKKGQDDMDLAQVFLAGGNVVVLWEDGRGVADSVFVRVSTDGGQTFQPEVRLDTDGFGDFESLLPQYAVAGDSIYVVWQDDRNGPHGVYMNYSHDAGLTWLTSDFQVDEGFDDCKELDIAAVGQHVYVVWRDSRSGPFKIFMNLSRDGGQTWLPSDQRLDTGNEFSRDPRLTVSGKKVHVVWLKNDGAGLYNVFYNRSGNAGRSWLGQDVRLDLGSAGSEAFDLQISSAGSRVFVAWAGLVNGQSDIFLNQSMDSGATWLGEVRIDTDPSGASDSFGTRLCVDSSGTRVFVGFLCDRNGDHEAFLNYSTDGGKTFLASDVLVKGIGPNDEEVDDFHMTCEGDAVWMAMTYDENILVNGGPVQ